MEPRDCTGEAWAAKARHALPPILGFTLAGSCSLLIEALLIWLALTFNAWYYATAVVWPMILCIMVYRKHWRSHIEHVVASRPDWQWKAAGMPAPAQSPHQQWEAKVLEKLVAGGVTLAQFSLEDLAVATQHFKHRIAISNQHRNLYMGVDPSTGQIIAVEQLPITAGPPEGRSWKEFQDRLTLCTVCPKYFLMVQLLGICVQGRLLVYQHMPNGSLEQWIFGQEGGMLLGWKQRMSIAVAMAKGLTQIHESRDTLMHLDITPENILLTDGFEPRLWVTRPVQLSRTIDLSQILLTKGYVAPEVLLHDIGFSHKSQVFSYGMVLLELVSGRRNRDDSVIYPECRYFPAWAQHCLNRETMDSTPAGLQGNRELAEELLDKRLQGAFVVEESLKLIKLGLWCIQRDPALRPEASTVLRMLEGQIEVSMPPLIPGFVEALKEAALSSCSSFRIASQRSSAWSSDLETEGT